MAAPMEVWTAAGSSPLSKWQNATKLRRSYDAEVRGYVVELSSLAGSSPKPSLNVSLSHPVLMLQLCLPTGTAISLELAVTDAAGIRRRLALSSAFSEAKVTALHAQVPLVLPRDEWVSLAVCVSDLLLALFGGAALRCTDTLTLSTVPKLRRIWALNEMPRDGTAWAQARDRATAPGPLKPGTTTTIVLDASSLAACTPRMRGSDSVIGSASRRGSSSPAQTGVHLAFGRRISSTAVIAAGTASARTPSSSMIALQRRGASAPAGSGQAATAAQLREGIQGLSPSAAPPVRPPSAHPMPARTLSDSAAIMVKRMAAGTVTPSRARWAAEDRDDHGVDASQVAPGSPSQSRSWKSRTSRPQTLALPALDEPEASLDNDGAPRRMSTSTATEWPQSPDSAGDPTPSKGWVPPPHLLAATVAATAALRSPLSAPPNTWSAPEHGVRPQLAPGLWLGAAPTSPNRTAGGLGQALSGSDLQRTPSAVLQQTTRHGLVHPPPVLLSLSLTPGAPTPEDHDDIVLTLGAEEE